MAVIITCYRSDSEWTEGNFSGASCFPGKFLSDPIVVNIRYLPQAKGKPVILSIDIF